jgi:site-specific DNA-methyltransferase (adenine-specific)
MKTFQLMQGNSLELLKTLEDNSVDAIVTDPPYGLSQHSQGDIVNALTAWLAGEEYTHGKAGFMGKAWDSFVPSPMLFKECYRVLKHGGHILCFAGARTQDLMSLSIRLAGFEMRDACLWLYGSGFPKGQNIAKGIEKLGLHEEAEKWEGYNTQIKPAYEPIIMARKPLDGTVVNNVLKHGVGGLNVDACRIGSEQRHNPSNFNQPNKTACAYMTQGRETQGRETQGRETQGRYPANIILDGSDSVEALFPYASKRTPDKAYTRNPLTPVCDFQSQLKERTEYNAINETEGGSASRYFYHAKASKKDRDEGLEDFELREAFGKTGSGKRLTVGGSKDIELPRQNPHPTVKATQLMRYLVKLVTPHGGLVLDPFMGSGSTGKACMLEGMRFIGMELSEEYVKIAEARIEHAYNQVRLLHA